MSLKFEILDKASAENAEAFLLLEQLDHSYFPQPWNSESWQNLFKTNNERWILMAFAEGELVGFTLFEISFVDSFAHLFKILINPSIRQKGLGFKLLNESLEALRERGIKSFFLEVEDQNISAIKLYKKLGFKIIHKKAHFYSNGSAALIMTLED